MAAIVTVFLMAWAIMVTCPDLPLSRRLHGWLVVTPVAFAARMTLGYVLLFGMMAASFATLAWFGGGDGLRVGMMAIPEMSVWAATFEVATLIDVLVAVGVAWSGLRGVIAGRSVLRPQWARRRTRAAVAPDAANDDDVGDRRPWSPVAA